MTELRLMAVHAHPDDESSKGAATLARYAAEGHRILVVTLTGGERGDILNPAMDLAEVRDRIADVRRDEMAEAADILRVEHRWLGFVDSGLPEGDPLPPLPAGCFAAIPLDEPVAELVKVVRDFRPHVMTTYDENGGYPHPDHIRCHQVSVAAYEAAADRGSHSDAGEPWSVSKLYYTHGFVRERMQLLQDEFTEPSADQESHGNGDQRHHCQFTEKDVGNLTPREAQHPQAGQFPAAFRESNPRSVIDHGKRDGARE